MRQVLEPYFIEYKKSKHRFLSLILPGALFLQLIFMLWNMGKISDYSQGWKAQLYNMTLLNSILMPSIISVFSSLLMDMEHRANSWKLLKTMHSPKELFIGKLLYGLINILLFCLLQLGGLLGVGTYYRFTSPIPFAQYGIYCISTFSICLILFSLQLLLSFVRDNQAVALSVGLGGSLIGIFINFFPRGLVYQLVPWGLFGAAGIVGMDWNRETRITTFYFTSPITGTFTIILLWLFILLLLGLKLFNEYDVERLHFFFLPFSRQNKKSTNEGSGKKTSFPTMGLSWLPSEWIKLKRSPLWLASLLLPCISALAGTLNYLGNIEILADKWYSLWTQHSLFFCALFMPALFGIYCSYLWQLEHKGTNLNRLLVLDSPMKIITKKLFTSVILLSLALLWQFILFLLCGKLAGIFAPLPKELISWFLCGFMGGVSICSAHIFLSLILRSFALPIGISTAGGIAGLVFTAKGIWYLNPYSLFCIGMRANNPNMEINLLQFIPACFIFSFVPYLLSILYLSRSDVRT